MICTCPVPTPRPDRSSISGCSCGLLVVDQAMVERFARHGWGQTAAKAQRIVDRQAAMRGRMFAGSSPEAGSTAVPVCASTTTPGSVSPGRSGVARVHATDSPHGASVATAVTS